MSEIIDLKDALERVQDDTDLLFELFDIFSEDFVGKRDTIWKALESHNVSSFQMIAHGFKGATGNISAKQMHETCVELDRMGKDADLSRARASLELLDKQFAELKVEIARLKKEYGK